MRYIFTNGDCAGARIADLEISDYVVPWQDVLHDGPVIVTDDLEAQSKQRAKFISKFAGMDFEDIWLAFQERDHHLKNIPLGAQIELWFEHDLYDQLQLAQILDEVHRNMPGHNVCLVQSDDFLGEMPDDAFLALQGQAKPVTKEEYEYASQVWQKFTKGIDDDFMAFLEEEAPLPFMQQAMQRLAQERPEDGGLPLSMQYVMAAVVEAGEMTLGQAFQAMQECEEAKFMGDLSFSHMMDDDITGSNPIFKPVSEPFMTVFEAEPQDYFQQKIKIAA